jgi:dTDP-4-dehydrorhamnose 3,5-epimerase
MKIHKTEFPDLLVIEPDVFGDERGYFFESYNKAKFELNGLDLNFVQDNFSKSVQGTIRGLHFQINPFAQGKLCQVIKGEVLDVAVDLRFNSPTFGKHFSLKLSEQNHLQLWIPEGFAHGFSVLSEEAIFHYKCTNFYNKESERVIIYNDSDLGIEWLVENPIVSEKDKTGMFFKDLQKYFIYGVKNDL